MGDGELRDALAQALRIPHHDAIAAHVVDQERALREAIAEEIGREQLDRHMEYAEAGDPINDFERGWRGGTVQALKWAERIARSEP